MYRFAFFLFLVVLSVNATQWPFKKSNGNLIKAKVPIGSPPQVITVEVDLVQGYFVIFEKKCESCEKTKITLFDQTKSDSLVIPGGTFTMPDTIRGFIHAKYGSDLVALGNGRDDNEIDFGISVNGTKYFVENAIGGLLGLTFQKRNEILAGASRFLKNQGEGRRHFTIYQNCNETDDGDHNGVITIGEDNNHNCYPYFEKFFLAGNNVYEGWSFKSYNITIGRKTISERKAVFVDPTKDISLFPPYEFSLIKKLFGALESNGKRKWQVNCGGHGSLHNIVIGGGLNGGKLVIPAESLIEEENNNCWLKIDSYPKRKYYADIVLGNHILDDYCVKYDYYNKAVQFHGVR